MFSDKNLQEAFTQHAILMEVKEGDVIMMPGQYTKTIPIVESGCIRVLRQNKQGDETFLYHIMPGETCALSLTCCATQKPSEIKAVAEEDTKLWAIPIQQLEIWQQFKEWREFVALTYQTRFDRLLKTVDAIAFEKMDEQLWRYLLARANAKESDILHISHEEIANELNMQREAATRLIKKLKDLGYLETGRNEIKLLRKG